MNLHISRESILFFVFPGNFGDKIKSEDMWSLTDFTLPVPHSNLQLTQIPGRIRSISLSPLFFFFNIIDLLISRFGHSVRVAGTGRLMSGDTNLPASHLLQTAGTADYTLIFFSLFHFKLEPSCCPAALIAFWLLTTQNTFLISYSEYWNFMIAIKTQSTPTFSLFNLID